MIWMLLGFNVLFSVIKNINFDRLFWFFKLHDDVV